MSIAPKDVLIDLLKANREMEEKPVIIDQEIKTENNNQKRNIDFN